MPFGKERSRTTHTVRQTRPATVPPSGSETSRSAPDPQDGTHQGKMQSTRSHSTDVMQQPLCRPLLAARLAVPDGSIAWLRENLGARRCAWGDTTGLSGGLRSSSVQLQRQRGRHSCVKSRRWMVNLLEVNHEPCCDRGQASNRDQRPGPCALHWRQGCR